MMRSSACFAAVCLLGLPVPPGSAQEKPLTRAFAVGASTSYRIQLTVRTELEGDRPVQIGAKTYVAPFSRSSQAGLSWVSTLRIQTVNPDATADVEETLENFQESLGDAESSDAETIQLSRAQQATFAAWERPRTLHYRETAAGQLLDLKPDGAPTLSENAPPVLTLWLLRAVRPVAALPAKPVSVRVPWQEPREVQLAYWIDVRGSETAEWLAERDSAEPALRLHVVQQISGAVDSGPEKPPEGAGEAHFHSESLSTISLLDGRLLSATRSAVREIIWTLAPVEGLPERPQFRGRLSVIVQVETCNETPCLSASGPTVH